MAAISFLRWIFHLYGTGGTKHGSSLGVDTRWVRSHCRRFCAERRKQELQSIVEQLKEK